MGAPSQRVQRHLRENHSATSCKAKDSVRSSWVPCNAAPLQNTAGDVCYTASFPERHVQPRCSSEICGGGDNPKMVAASCILQSPCNCDGRPNGIASAQSEGGRPA